MTDPATSRDFRKCGCGSHTRGDLAGDPPLCWACGKSLVDSVNRTPPQNDAPRQSPIVGRSAFKSASLRRAEQAAAAATRLRHVRSLTK